MKRLHQPYRTTLSMSEDSRDVLFDMEMQLIEEEKKQNSSKTDLSQL
jgi:hypothetical protein